MYLQCSLLHFLLFLPVSLNLHIQATREEAEIRHAEMKKSSYEFNRDIVLGARNPRTGRVISERVTRYFEDKMRTRKALIEKMRLKNSTLKVQKKKLQLQLKQKEEMGEVRFILRYCESSSYFQLVPILILFHIFEQKKQLICKYAFALKSQIFIEQNFIAVKLMCTSTISNIQ